MWLFVVGRVMTGARVLVLIADDISAASVPSGHPPPSCAGDRGRGGPAAGSRPTRGDDRRPQFLHVLPAPFLTCQSSAGNAASGYAIAAPCA